MQTRAHLYFLSAGNHANSILEYGDLVPLLLRLRKLRARLGFEGNVYRICDNCPAGSPYKPIFWPETGVPSALVKIHPEQWRGLPKHGTGARKPPTTHNRSSTGKPETKTNRVSKLVKLSS